MKKECEKSFDGKHQIEKRIITGEEVKDNHGITVYRNLVYAEYCIKCQKWGKLFN